MLDKVKAFLSKHLSADAVSKLDVIAGSAKDIVFMVANDTVAEAEAFVHAEYAKVVLALAPKA